MSHDPERRLSTGGLPPVQIREHYVVEEVPSHDSTPCYTAWVRQEIVKVPQGWSASDFGSIPNERPSRSFQVYDTRPQAVDPDHLKSLAETLHRETHEELGEDNRIDVWGMPFAVDTSEEEKIAKCKAHILAEIAARETAGDVSFQVPRLRGHYHWNRAILIIDQPEQSWNEDGGGFLAVYWDTHPEFQQRLEKVYGKEHQEPETSASRSTRDGLGNLLLNLWSFF
jgi:hypothetical protein